MESDALRRDLTEKDEVIRQLKSDILRLDYKTETEREELRNFVSEKQLVIEELDVSQCSLICLTKLYQMHFSQLSFGFEREKLLFKSRMTKWRI